MRFVVYVTLLVIWNLKKKNFKKWENRSPEELSGDRCSGDHFSADHFSAYQYLLELSDVFIKNKNSVLPISMSLESLHNYFGITVKS